MACVFGRAAAAFLLTLVLGLAPAAAHEGHDHGAPPPAGTTVAPRGEAASDAFQIVAIARGGELAIFVDRFAGNEPVTDAVVEVETPAGPVTASASADQTYRLAAPWLAKPGRYDVVVTVTAGGDVDVLPVSIEVPAEAAAAAGGTTGWRVVLPIGAAAAGFGLGIALMALRRRRPAAAAVALALAAAFTGEARANGAASPVGLGRDLSQRLPDGSIFVPKTAQRILSIRTVVTAAGKFRHVAELPGRIIADPNASGLVQASVGGRLSAPPGGLFPALGSRVAAGEVLAYVTPPLQAIDVSDLRQKQGELDQQIAIIERRVRRFEPLAKTGAIPAIQLEESQLELAGLRDRRSALDKVRREPEALLAPVAGVIAEGVAVAGQIAQPNTVIFRIIDPARLWVEALSFAALPSVHAATARNAAGQSFVLALRGAGYADRSQAVPVHFAVEGVSNGLHIGQFVTVFASGIEERAGIALPRTAIVRTANGQDVVYDHVGAERFMARPVRFVPLDGERALVVSGLEPGKRVVVQGAELLDQVR